MAPYSTTGHSHQWALLMLRLVCLSHPALQWCNRSAPKRKRPKATDTNSEAFKVCMNIGRATKLAMLARCFCKIRLTQVMTTPMLPARLSWDQNGFCSEDNSLWYGKAWCEPCILHHKSESSNQTTCQGILYITVLHVWFHSSEQ